MILTTPSVCSVMLTADRERSQVERAVKCFQAQQHPEKFLVVFDTGKQPHFKTSGTGYPYSIGPRAVAAHFPELAGRPIGELRNCANDFALMVTPWTPKYFAHWDSDDWSHPARLTLAMSALETPAGLTICDAFGYSDLLFWDEAKQEAWYYKSTSSYLLGTSLVYRTTAWKTQRFDAVGRGEDRNFIQRVGSRGAPSFVPHFNAPLMVATIHARNNCRVDATSENWLRVPQWDERLPALLR